MRLRPASQPVCDLLSDHRFVLSYGCHAPSRGFLRWCAGRPHGDGGRRPDDAISDPGRRNESGCGGRHRPCLQRSDEDRGRRASRASADGRFRAGEAAGSWERSCRPRGSRVDSPASGCGRGCRSSGSTRAWCRAGCCGDPDAVSCVRLSPGHVVGSLACERFKVEARSRRVPLSGLWSASRQWGAARCSCRSWSLSFR